MRSSVYVFGCYYLGVNVIINCNDHEKKFKLLPEQQADHGPSVYDS